MTHAIRDCLLVAFGGALGSLTRYAAGMVAARLLGQGFPWGTLLVNVAGCFAMGIVLELIADLEAHSPAGLTASVRGQLAFWHKAVAIGFLGGLTTFSTFSGDTLRELLGGQTGIAFTNIAANVILSLAAVWCGLAIMQALD